MLPLQLWLFDEPPVTVTEIADWVKEATNLTPDNWRFHYYVKGWRVIDKIRDVKKYKRDRTAGTFDKGAGRPPPRQRRNPVLQGDGDYPKPIRETKR